MIALDTNIIVRLFVDDESSREQALLVRKFLSHHKCVYISQIVQIELVWVLMSSYQFDKNTVIDVLEILYKRDDFSLENPQQFYRALMLFKQGNADFSDYLIFANSEDNGLPFFTFDKKLGKTQGATRLTKAVVAEFY